MPELRQDVLGFFTRCAREHGDLCAMRFFHLRCVLVSHPDLIERVLVTENERMRKAWDVRHLRMALGDGLLTSDGPVWRRHRTLIQPAFHAEQIRRYARVMTKRAAESAQSWRDGATLDLHAEMMRLTLAIVAESLFGIEIAPHVERVERALDAIMREFEQMETGYVPGPLRWITPVHWRARRRVRELDGALAAIIARRRADAAGGEREDLLGALVAARDERALGLTDREIRDELVTLLMAGHETTALALSWSLYLLAQHPEAEARLAAELRDVLGDRLPGPQDQARLAYTRQVIREALRLYPPAWGIGRETLQEIELGGYRIPRGTQIFLVPWVTHRDPRFFPEPDRFRPERWSAEAALPRYAYFPFGGGPRHCVGSGFAMAEATLLLAVIARRWRFELVRDGTIELQPAVTLRPRHGIRAVARRRAS